MTPTFQRTLGETLISVITVVYQGVASLEPTIKSVLAQTYPNIEYIVIDGGSKDGTIDIIRKYESSIHYWISEPDKGIYDAMNKGARVATGSWMLFLNAGDSFFEDTAIEKFNDAFPGRSLPLPDLVFSDVMMVYPDGNEEKRDLRNTLPFLIRNMICHQCMFYSKDIFKHVGFFNADYRFASDFEHFARVKWGGFKIAKLHTIIARYSLDGVTAQRDNIKKIWKERMKIYERDNEMPVLTRALFWLYAKAAYEFRSRFQ